MVVWWAVRASAGPVVDLAPEDLGAEREAPLLVEDDEEVGAARVVNGTPVTGRDWEDAVGIAFGNQVGCTGTLIAPDVVLTAGHCAGGITHAVVGTNNTNGGDWIRARRTIEYPRSQSTFDVALVLLERDATGIAPRPLAVDCVLEEHLRDGARVAVVGFGATDYAGNRSTNVKHEGYTHVQDADCSEGRIDGYTSGCNPAARPAGEIGAGGNDVDTCFGDSGGPLYLLGGGDAYLVGVTSRSYAGVPYNQPCRYGGIYTRPDAVLDWIEDQAGPVALPVCNAAPKVKERTITVRGGRAETVLAFTDPDPAPEARWSLASPPKHGRVEVEPDGTLVYVADPGFVGRDTCRVAVDDGGNPDWPRTGAPLQDEGVITFDVRDEPAAPGAPDGDGDPAGDDAVAVLDTEPDGASYHALGCDTGRRAHSPAVGGLLVLVVRRQRAVARVTRSGR